MEFNSIISTKGRKIIPLKFDSWSPFSVGWVRKNKKGFFQPLMSFAEMRIDLSRQNWIAERTKSSFCPCCGIRLSEVHRMLSNDETGTRVTYNSCSTCGFWRRHLEDSITLGEFVIPSIREFDTAKETPSISRLAEEISSCPEKLYEIEPYKFERFVGSILQDYFDCEVYHVGQTGDDGIDLYAVVKDNPILIQVKRRSFSRSVEGLNVVKLLFASAFAKGANNWMVVTTAQRFSRNAQRWRKSPRLIDVGFNIKLIDFQSLMSMVNCVSKKDDPPPWSIHKLSSKVTPRFSSEKGWKHYGYETSDILLRCYNEIATALIYQHDYLGDCLVVTGAEQTITYFVENWLPEIVLDNADISSTLRRNDTDLAHEMAISFELQDKLAMKWAELYPERVTYALP